jgi:hypothetical protein
VGHFALWGLVAAVALALVFASRADAVGVTKCYFPQAGTCSWGWLQSGASGFAFWNHSFSEGGAMPANGGANTSRRWRIIDDNGNHRAGWWTNALGNPIAVTWSQRDWVNYQCNNMEPTQISVYCRSDNLV